MKKERKYTHESVTALSKGHSRGSFWKLHKAAYNYALKNDMLDSLFGPRAAPSAYKIEDIKSAMSKCSNLTQFNRKYSAYVKFLKKKLIYKDLCDEFFPLRLKKYTKEFLVSEARDCAGSRALIRKNESLYNFANRNGFLEEIFGEKKKARIDKDNEYKKSLIDTCRKYKTRGELIRSNKKAYNSVLKRKMEGECFSHMSAMRISSLPQLILFRIMNNILNCEGIYNCRGVLSGRKEIDMFYPSLKIGIEYDGYFWHRSKEKRDLDKDIEAAKLGIKLFRLVSNRDEDSNIGNCEKYVKNIFIEQLLDGISEFLGKNISKEYVMNIDIGKDSIFKEVFNENEIIQAIKSSSTAKEFRKKYSRMYNYMFNHERANLIKIYKNRFNIIGNYGKKRGRKIRQVS